jgi:hypothetical protein
MQCGNEHLATGVARGVGDQAMRAEETFGRVTGQKKSPVAFPMRRGFREVISANRDRIGRVGRERFGRKIAF